MQKKREKERSACHPIPSLLINSRYSPNASLPHPNMIWHDITWHDMTWHDRTSTLHTLVLRHPPTLISTILIITAISLASLTPLLEWCSPIHIVTYNLSWLKKASLSIYDMTSNHVSYSHLPPRHMDWFMPCIISNDAYHNVICCCYHHHQTTDTLLHRSQLPSSSSPSLLSHYHLYSSGTLLYSWSWYCITYRVAPVLTVSSPAHLHYLPQVFRVPLLAC